ncbi:REP element-mobilizing transposase RayT [Algoriphagus ornithinivorans]|uniref:REP element-mobilizing transposase RayT n=1 Tax=Algoriphagus ornithinivorans TaxID=226506 RepID=A0A1I5JK78_9BACT|nr:transposase [Algoriphagus ornithinivorans]SFO72786.1 REP element-mobilizing transposase RayT [Algoriphagus ornithinivorans]
MGREYIVKDQEAVHYVTFTVHQWVDVFSRKCYAEIFLESLKYCQLYKGLEVYAWVIMTNHCHLIIQAKNNNLSDIIRDLRKYTSKMIYKAIIENPKESRKKWLALTLSFKDHIWFWEKGYHGEEIFSNQFFEIKANYIHENPVRAGIVEKPEDYLMSSAGDYLGIRKGPLDLAVFG